MKSTIVVHDRRWQSTSVNLERFQLDKIGLGPFFLAHFLRLAAAFEVLGVLHVLVDLVGVEQGDRIAKRALGPRHFHLVGQQFLLERRSEYVLGTETGRHDDALLQDIKHVTSRDKQQQTSQ